MELQRILPCAIIVVFRYPSAFGRTNSLCYIQKDYNKQMSLCVLPTSQVECCTREHVSVDKIEVYRKDGCDSVRHCGSGKGCCTTDTLIDISSKYKAALEEAFKSTNCFNSVDERHLQSQLPMNEGLDHIIVSYTCTENNNTLTVAVAVPLTIIALCVVAVTVLYFKRKLSNQPSSKDDAGTDNPDVSGVIGSRDSVPQYLNVVPPTYEQLSRQQTDGEYTELTGVGANPVGVDIRKDSAMNRYEGTPHHNNISTYYNVQ